jgi:hypothetical protein
MYTNKFCALIRNSKSWFIPCILVHCSKMVGFGSLTRLRFGQQSQRGSRPTNRHCVKHSSKKTAKYLILVPPNSTCLTPEAYTDIAYTFSSITEPFSPVTRWLWTRSSLEPMSSSAIGSLIFANPH